MCWNYEKRFVLFSLLVVLFIILLFAFGPQGPIGLISLKKRDLPEFEIKFEKMERFNSEAATGGAQ